MSAKVCPGSPLDLPSGRLMPTPLWSVRVILVEARSQFEGFHVLSASRFQYVMITLEYTPHGNGTREFRPESVILVHVGPTPLQGLTRRPTFFRAARHSMTYQSTEGMPIGCVEPGTAQTGTFGYEFHKTCHDFQLYFPGCETIAIRLPSDEREYYTVRAAPLLRHTQQATTLYPSWRPGKAFDV